MKLSDDEYYRELRQNTASKEGSDSVGARTNHTGPRRTASVFRGSAAHCSEVPGSPGISQGVVWAQEVAGLVGRSVQYTDTTLLGAGPVGAGELGHQEDMFPFKYIFELFMFYSYFSLEQLFLNSVVLCR